MAIDTKKKRMNMLSVCNPIGWALHPEIDSTVVKPDRAQLLHLYGGNTFAGELPTPKNPFGNMLMGPFAGPVVP